MSETKQQDSQPPFTTIFNGVLKNDQPMCIAFLGGGGKSSLISRLGEEFSREYDRVALTSLTKSGATHTEAVCFPKNIDSRELSVHFALANPLKILRESDHPEKLNGVSVSELRGITNFSDVCLFECDGARKLPLKIHEDHDPVVPDFADCVVIVVGADAVHTTPEEGKVHRADKFCHYWGISPTTVLSPDFIATVITSKKGYGQKIPERIKKVYFVNKADTFEKNAEELAKSIWGKVRCPTFYGSIQQGFRRRIP